MNHPIEPIEPPATPPSGPSRSERAAFSSSLPGSAVLRVGVVLTATLVLLVSAALAFGASPAPSSSAPGAAPQAPAGGNAGPRLRDPGFLGGGGFGSRFGGRGGGAGFGGITISAIDGSSVSLKTQDGWARTITVTGTTKLTRGGATIALGDLKVGDQVRFHQTRSSDGTFTVDAIEVVLPRVAGEVTAVTADGFTLKTRDNATWTITVTDSTKFMLGGAAGSKADVTVGTRVGVAGDQTADNALTATTVQIAVPKVAGKVTAKTADTITIERLGGGTATIHVSGSTTFRVPGKASGSLSDIAVGMIVGAQGRQRADGSIDATAVGAAPKLGRWFGGPRGANPKAGPNAAPNATPGSYNAG